MWFGRRWWVTQDQVGTVIKSVGGFHTVSLATGEELRVAARGRLKRKGTILAGDRVLVRTASGGEIVVEEVLERKSALVRPPVANVSLMVVVTACDDPPPNFDLLDRILIQVGLEGIRSIIVWNKADLVTEVEADRLAFPYRTAGYRTVFTSVLKGTGILALTSELAHDLSVVAGPSGVGKSSLLNALIPQANLETQSVSKKTQRGRHTTREVSLWPLGGGGWIADSPGFSTLAIGTIDPRTLRDMYPEFRNVGAGCRFSGCLHRQEPACSVRAAVERGEVDQGRYSRYLRILNEVERSFERRY